MAEQQGKVAEAFVEIGARTEKFEKDLKKDERKIKKATQDLEKKTQVNPFSGITGAMFKALAVMGTLELGLKGVQAASAAISGDWEKSAEIIKQLPAGIGPVAQAMEGILGDLSGISGELALMNQRMKAFAIGQAVGGGLLGRQATAQAGFAEIERLLRRQEQLSGAVDAEAKAALEATFAEEDRKRAIEERIEAMRTSVRLTKEETQKISELKEEIDKLQKQIGASSFIAEQTGITLGGTPATSEIKAQIQALKNELKRLQTIQGRQVEFDAQAEKLLERLNNLSPNLPGGAAAPGAPGDGAVRQISLSRELTGTQMARREGEMLDKKRNTTLKEIVEVLKQRVIPVGGVVG